MSAAVRPLAYVAAFITLAVLLVGAAGGPADAARPTHARLRTAHGPVHVWTPAHYEPATAGVVVYVHGYYTDVDGAWRNHRLARQFAASKINALFVACEAPRGPRGAVRWERLAPLLATVAEARAAPLPPGPVVVVGHSGAHRTIARWLEEDHLDTLVLVDALYGELPGLRAWLDADDAHRLIHVAAQTRRWSDALDAAVPATTRFERFPPRRTGRMRAARGARVIYVRSQYDHMALVTRGVALPLLLRALRLPTADEVAPTVPAEASRLPGRDARDGPRGVAG